MEAVSETLLRVNPLYFLIVATYVLTVVHALALRFVPRARVPQVYAAGGRATSSSSPGSSTSPAAAGRGFILLYPLSVLAGSVLLRRPGRLVLAGVGQRFSTAALSGAVRSGLIPARGPGRGPVPARSAILLLGAS